MDWPPENQDFNIPEAVWNDHDTQWNKRQPKENFVMSFKKPEEP